MKYLYCNISQEDKVKEWAKNLEEDYEVISDPEVPEKFLYITDREIGGLSELGGANPKVTWKYLGDI